MSSRQAPHGTTQKPRPSVSTCHQENSTEEVLVRSERERSGERIWQSLNVRREENGKEKMPVVLSARMDVVKATQCPLHPGELIQHGETKGRGEKRCMCTHHSAPPTSPWLHAASVIDLGVLHQNGEAGCAPRRSSSRGSLR